MISSVRAKHTGKHTVFFFLKNKLVRMKLGLTTPITAEDVIIKELKVFFLFGLLQVVESSQKRI